MNRTVRIATAAALIALVVGVVTSAGAAPFHSAASAVSLAKKYAKKYAKPGPRGPRGSRGPQGPQGDRGSDGAQGPAGVTAFHVVAGPEVTMGTTCNSGSDCSQVKSAEATCPAGEVPTGGGYNTTSINATVDYLARTGKD